MNGTEIVTEIIEIVDDPYYSDRQTILKYANQSLLDLAGKLLLPDLQDGYDTVTTGIDSFIVNCPSTFLKNLYLAQVDGVPIDVHEDLGSMVLALGGLCQGDYQTGSIVILSNKGPFQTRQDLRLRHFRIPGLHFVNQTGPGQHGLE